MILQGGSPLLYEPAATPGAAVQRSDARLQVLGAPPPRNGRHRCFNRIFSKGMMGDKPDPAAPTGKDLRQKRKKLLADYERSLEKTRSGKRRGLGSDSRTGAPEHVILRGAHFWG